MPRRAATERAGPHQRFFDLWSLVYDAALVQRLTYKPVQDAVVRELQRAPAGSALDVGCGTGLLTTRIRDELDRVCVGCDFSQGMLRQAAHRSRSLPLVRGDALGLPFRDASFAAVVATEAFHWFPDQGQALSEFRRVLTPGGRLLVALINPPSELLSKLTRRGSRVFGEPLRWPTRSQLRELAESRGFDVEDQRTVLRVPASLLFPCVLTVATRR